jgi:TonB family protein
MSKSHNRLFHFELWLEKIADLFFTFWNRHKVGILGTIVLNMIALILLLSLELRSRTHLYETIVMVDFDREYAIIPEEEELETEPLLPRDALDPNYEYEAIRNIALDATKEDLNPGLVDEKKIDADELYQEAQRIREQMLRNRELWEESQGIDEDDIPNIEDKTITPLDEGQYKGPTVISYFLEGRKARYLPVPSYKCELGGRVVVDIEVLRDGRVAKATIDIANSVQDPCMNAAAMEAARASFFTKSPQADTPQKGSITYLFVPQ